MRLFGLVTFSILLLPRALDSLSAQTTPGGMSPGGIRRGGGMRHGGGEGMRGAPKAADPVILDGPPAPAQMTQLVDLNDAQLPQYDSLYQAFMNQTQSERDSARAAQRLMETAFQGGDREAARERGSSLRDLTNDLGKQQKAFDDRLKDLLTKDQRNAYEDWRDQQRKFAEDQQRERWQRRGGEGRPPGA